MGELLQLPKRPVREAEDPYILEVRSGVYLSNEVPSEALLAEYEFVTAAHFASAGERVGKSGQFGRNIMRVMALSLAQNEHVDVFAASVVDPSRAVLLSQGHMISFINRITQDPKRIKQGSWSQLLFTPQLVRDTWAHAQGSELAAPRILPRVSSAGQRVVSQVVADLYI